MNILRFLCPSLFCVFLSFCSSKDETNQIYVNTGEVPINIPLSQLFDTVLIVPLETREDALIGTVSKVYATENQLFVLDKKIAQALFLFDLKGKLLHSFIGTGEGPGEFVRASNFYVSHDMQSVFIQDYSISKIVQFGLDGTFIREKRISPQTQFYDLLPVKSGFYAAIPDENNLGVFVGLLDRELELAGTKIPINQNEVRIEWNMKDHFFYRGTGENIFFKETLRNTLYHFKPGNAVRSMNFDFADREWKPRKNKINLKEAYHDIWKSGGYALGDQVLDTEKMTLINFWQGKALKMLRVDKETGQAKVVGKFVNDIDGYVDGLSGILPSNSGAGQLIVDFHPNDFISLGEEKEGIGAYRRRMEEILVDGYDNPILFIYKKTK